MRFDTAIPIKLKDAYAARHEPEALRLIARVYWASLILCTATVVLLAIAYGVWEFTRNPRGDDGLGDVRPQAAFTRAQLQELLGKFDARAVRFEERLTAPVTAKDPS